MYQLSSMDTTYIVVILVVSNWAQQVQSKQQVPCLFVFGDSLVDNGNNHDLITKANPITLPYGIDFPYGPTGRACNGRTTVDVMSQLLGFKDFIPAYAYAKDQHLYTGVNYGSGGGGIRDESGRDVGEHYSMNDQLRQFQTTVQRLGRVLGSEHAAAKHLNQCIYSVNMGTNDYINNYFWPQYFPTSAQYDLKSYAEVLIDQYSRQLKTLYIYGARKVALTAVGPVGCLPATLFYSGYPNNGSCVTKLNDAVKPFNARLKLLAQELTRSLPGSQFIFVNTFDVFLDIRNHASSYGMKVKDTACCGLGPFNSLITCQEFITPCSNRSEYLFWDFAHPTEAFNVIFTNRIYSSESLNDVSPMNLKRLAEL